MRRMTFARSCWISALILAVALASFPAAAADPPSKSPPDEAAVRALIGRWLDAQNKGDFAAYSAMYTPSFHGIRRSLGRTVMITVPCSLPRVNAGSRSRSELSCYYNCLSGATPKPAGAEVTQAPSFGAS